MAFFRDLLKKWFYTNNSSAASNDARIPLLNANGTPKGSDTMANIASVLGEIPSPKQMQFLNNIDLNTILGDERGSVSQTYRCSSSCINSPIAASDGYMTVYRWSASNYSTQIFHNPNYNKTFIRSNRDPDNVSWTVWEEYSLNIPDFYKSYQDLGSLASALGVKRFYGKTIDTGINVNAGTGGRTLLVLLAVQGGDGSQTFAQFDMVRLGYDGDNYFVTNIAKNGQSWLDTISYSLSDSKTLVVSCPIVNIHAMVVSSNYKEGIFPPYI